MDQSKPVAAMTMREKMARAAAMDLQRQFIAEGGSKHGADLDTLSVADAVLSAMRESGRLWLWKNFVDGRQEYWAFDNPYPCDPDGNPMTLGSPCGWAVFKDSENGNPKVPDSEIEAEIRRSSPPS